MMTKDIPSEDIATSPAGWRKPEAVAELNTEANATGKKVLGLWFYPMGPSDWDGFAGAAEGTLIHYCDDDQTALLLAPDGTISEIFSDEQDSTETIWTPTQVAGR